MGILDDLAMKLGKDSKNLGKNLKPVRTLPGGRAAKHQEFDPLMEQGLEEYFDMYSLTPSNKKFEL